MLAALSLALAQTAWQAPFQDLKTPKTPEAYAQKLGDRPLATFLDGDVFTIAWKAEPGLIMSPGFTLTEHEVPNTNIKIAQAKMSDWDKAFFNIGVFGPGKPTAYEMYAGPKAPPLPERASELKGTLTKHKFTSNFIEDERDIHVYLPPDAQPNIPVVYLTDGSATQNFAQVVEPLILSGKIQPVALIGVFSGSYQGNREEPYDPNKDLRAQEYLKVIESEQYDKHLDFYLKEVLPWAEEEFKVSRLARHRALMGYSNGGAFAVTSTVDRPLVFGSVMAYSVAAFDPETLKEDVKGKKLSNYFIAAGTLEPFIRGSQRSAETLRTTGAPVDLDIFVSSHSSALWEVAFVKHLQKIFPASPAQSVGSRNDRPNQPGRSQGNPSHRPR